LQGVNRETTEPLPLRGAASTLLAAQQKPTRWVPTTSTFWRLPEDLDRDLLFQGVLGGIAVRHPSEFEVAGGLTPPHIKVTGRPALFPARIGLAVAICGG
jgi:hypothetical protein